MRSKIGIGRQMDDLLRKRIDDVVSKSSRSSGIADGEWLDPEVGPPYQPAYRLPYGAPWVDQTPNDAGDLRRADFEYPRAELRATAPAGPLDDLLREIDRRGGADAGIAQFQLHPAATPDRALREYVDKRAPERDEPFAFSSERWSAPRNHDCDPPRASGDRSTSSAFDRAPPTFPLACSFDVAAGEGAWRSTMEPFAGTGPTAISPLAQLRRDGMPDDAGEWLRRGSALQGNDGSTKPLDTIARQLDELARELDQRERGATTDEIAAFKQRLTALARETETEAERKLLDRGGNGRELLATSGRFEQSRPSEAVDECGSRHLAQPLRARRHEDWSDFDAVWKRFGAPAMPADPRRTDAIESDLAMMLNSVVLQRGPEPHGQPSEVVQREPAETEAPKRDGLFAVASDRWLARPDHQRDRPATIDDRPPPSAIDRDLPPIPPARSMRPRKKKPSRATMVPIVRAGLAAVLAIAIVVTGAYFARSRMADVSAVGPTVAIVHQSAPTGEAAASTGPLTVMPANSVARFQDLVFQLPRLYGIYAINSGRLFELEALPGHAPDPRIAVSAAIPRPSHTKLPDGRVAFLLFRRDMATNIPERVAIRVVAKIKRPASDPAAEQRAAGPDDAWTIRNIAVDFRVAPVEHNKEMVLLLSEKSDFTFPAGRYALILKGQAYDFTVAGPITDPAQCLERVDAANGGFFHECQVPQAAAEPSSQDAPPLAARFPSKPRRQGEVHARAEELLAKPRTSR